jgi:hypothetical protein
LTVAFLRFLPIESVAAPWLVLNEKAIWHDAGTPRKLEIREIAPHAKGERGVRLPGIPGKSSNAALFLVRSGHLVVQDERRQGTGTGKFL